MSSFSFFCFRLLSVVPMATDKLEIDKYDMKSDLSIWRRKMSDVLIQNKFLPHILKLEEYPDS